MPGFGAGAGVDLSLRLGPGLWEPWEPLAGGLATVGLNSAGAKAGFFGLGEWATPCKARLGVVLGGGIDFATCMFSNSSSFGLGF